MNFKFIELKKISWKLTIIYAAIFSLLLILLNAGILYGVKFFLTQQSISQVENTSNITAEKIIGTPGDQTSLTDSELLDEARSNSDINIIIANPSGIIVNSSDKLNIDHIDITTNIDIVRKLEASERHLIVKNSKIISGGKVKAYLQVVKNMEKEYTFIKLLFVLMALADLFGIIISVFAGYVISKKILTPIDRITKTAKEIGLSGLSTRIEVTSADDELTRLARTFNEMLDRIKESFERQGRFVADASHELRTPVSIIQGYIGMIDRWGKEEPKILQESIDAIKNETASMSLMIERLLFLARGDNGKQMLQKSWFMIDELFEEIAKECSMLSMNHIFSFQSCSGEEFFADRKMIKQMLRAILDNSIKFTPEKGKISLSCAKDDGNTVFTVSDTGMGMPDEEQNKVFERFYRVDKARDRETGGSGLGLSIVKWIVDAHDGLIKISSTVGEGTVVTVSLPNYPKK